MKKKILLVEDRIDIAELIIFHLKKNGYDVLHATNGEEALDMLRSHSFDLIVLDLMLPKMSGVSLLEIVKQDPLLSKIPVIIESAKGEDADIIMGLELGAEDYISKPFSPRVLVARIKKIFLRSEPQDENHFCYKSSTLFLDAASREVKIEGELVLLTAIEFDLLLFLLTHESKVVSREKILKNVWLDEVLVVDRVIDVHINALRKKLGIASKQIETVRGIGYKFRPGD